MLGTHNRDTHRKEPKKYECLCYGELSSGLQGELACLPFSARVSYRYNPSPDFPQRTIFQTAREGTQINTGIYISDDAVAQIMPLSSTLHVSE